MKALSNVSDLFVALFVTFHLAAAMKESNSNMIPVGDIVKFFALAIPGVLMILIATNAIKDLTNNTGIAIIWAPVLFIFMFVSGSSFGKALRKKIRIG